MVRAIVWTDSKSPGDETGKPTSITSTPIRSRASAICSFSFTLRLACNACSPSRKVLVSLRAPCYEHKKTRAVARVFSLTGDDSTLNFARQSTAHSGCV
ncbi:hypothetical protein Lal_00008992 [Lupinus albus]|nr:hypothetical protein Lal_00008992 [Lupinus albus]